MEISRAELVKRMVESYGYPMEAAEVTAASLDEMCSDVKSAFEKWWIHGEEPQIEIGGITYGILVRDHGLKPPAAFLTMDWLEKEPEAALAAVKRGHDSAVDA